MVSSEREMVRKLLEDEEPADRFTSLQPTYEDSVPPEQEWDERDDS